MINKQNKEAREIASQIVEILEELDNAKDTFFFEQNNFSFDDKELDSFQKLQKLLPRLKKNLPHNLSYNNEEKYSEMKTAIKNLINGGLKLNSDSTLDSYKSIFKLVQKANPKILTIT